MHIFSYIIISIILVSNNLNCTPIVVRPSDHTEEKLEPKKLTAKHLLDYEILCANIDSGINPLLRITTQYKENQLNNNLNKIKNSDLDHFFLDVNELKNGAEINHAFCQFTLGMYKLNKAEVVRSNNRNLFNNYMYDAYNYFRRATENNFERAFKNYSFFLLTGMRHSVDQTKNIKIELKKGYMYLHKAAIYEQQFCKYDLMLPLAWCLLNGIGCKKNYDLGRSYIQKAKQSHTTFFAIDPLGLDIKTNFNDPTQYVIHSDHDVAVVIKKKPLSKVKPVLNKGLMVNKLLEKTIDEIMADINSVSDNSNAQTTEIKQPHGKTRTNHNKQITQHQNKDSKIEINHPNRKARREQQKQSRIKEQELTLNEKPKPKKVVRWAKELTEILEKRNNNLKREQDGSLVSALRLLDPSMPNQGITNLSNNQSVNIEDNDEKNQYEKLKAENEMLKRIARTSKQNYEYEVSRSQRDNKKLRDQLVAQQKNHDDETTKFIQDNDKSQHKLTNEKNKIENANKTLKQDLDTKNVELTSALQLIEQLKKQLADKTAEYDNIARDLQKSHRDLQNMTLLNNFINKEEQSTVSLPQSEETKCQEGENDESDESDDEQGTNDLDFGFNDEEEAHYKNVLKELL